MGLDGSLENDADSFWNEDYASATMRQFKDTRTTADFVHRRIDAERIEEANPLCGKRPDGTYGSLYTSANVFPDWIKTRGDFEEVDRIIKEQHLSRALKALPHLRAASDLDLVSAFVLTSWRKAQELGPKRVALIAKCVSYFFVQAGDYILNEGESSRTFYIIVTGEVYIHKKAAMSAGHDGIVATLKAGQSFGEIALEMGGGCTASVVAKTEVELLVLYKSDYDQIMKDYKEQERADALHILKNIPMFKNWARSRLERVAQLLQRKRFDAGTPIIKQGDPPDNVYFIHEGVCEVTKDITIERTNCWPTGPKTWKKVVRKKKVPFKILDLHRGGFFGEKAIIEDNVRAATVSALTDVWVFYVDKIEFMSLLNMGYKAQSDAAGGVQGYPNDEDILNLFSSLNVGGPKKKTLVKVQKPKKKAKDSAAGKKEGGGRRVTTAPFGATRSPKAFTPKGSAVVRTPMRQQEQQQQGSGGGDGGMFFGDDMLPMPELGMQRRPVSFV
jgi:CRP-like cAMP-binding protein